MQSLPSIALIGCGAISEMTYLPALAANPSWRSQSWLVEPNAARGLALARRFGFAADHVLGRHEDLPDTITMAINATPSHLHRPVTASLLQRHMAVLVEKPFAETAEDARALIALAAAHGCVLSVNQSRRAGPSNALIRTLIRSGKIGQVTKIRWHEGRPFDWPTQSGFNFRRPWQGCPRGVLLDIGVHVLDLLYWWLGEQADVLSATTDGQGGPEASASVALLAGKTSIDIRLSYLVKLANEVVIEGTKGAIRASTADYDRIELRLGEAPWRNVKARGSVDAVANTAGLIANVVEAATRGAPLKIDAADTVPTLDVIDAIYARSNRLLSQCYADHLPTRDSAPARRALEVQP